MAIKPRISRPISMIGAANMNHPRLQRAVLRAGASPLRNQIGAIQDVTRQFTANDLNTRLKFAELGLQDMRHQDSLRFAYERLDLAKKQANFQDKIFKQGIHDQQQDLNRSMVLGAPTAGLSFLEGRRRAAMTAQLTKEKRELNELMKKYYRSKI